MGVGGQKCGTSWLCGHLYQHPQVLRHTVKEMHVFDSLASAKVRASRIAETEGTVATLERHLAAPDPGTKAPPGYGRAGIAARVRDRKELLGILRADEPTARRLYAEYFADRVRPHHLGFGEFTPGYALLAASGFAGILSIYPDARFIFLMRDPVDRMWSALRHRQREHPDLDPVEQFADLVLQPDVADRSAYEQTLTALDDAVPAHQRLELFYEDLFDPTSDDALRHVSTFLQIEHRDADRLTRRNEGTVAALPAELATWATEVFLPTYEFVLARYGRLPDRWRERMDVVAPGSR